MIRDGDHRAAPGNTMQIAGGALALDAEPFEKFFKELLAGGLANCVGPGYVEFFGQKELFEKPPWIGVSANSARAASDTGWGVVIGNPP